MSVDELVPYSFETRIEMIDLPDADLCAGVMLYVGPDKSPRIGWDEQATFIEPQTILVREQKTMMRIGMSGLSNVLNHA